MTPTTFRPESKTILLVDDDRDCRSLVRQLLEGSAYRVIEASDGQDGIKKVQETSPDLVIADFNMPRMNGFEFIQEMKSVLELRKIPILLLTGSPNRQHLRGIGLDIAEFLEKPATGSRILEAVADALQAPASIRPLKELPRDGQTGRPAQTPTLPAPAADAAALPPDISAAMGSLDLGPGDALLDMISSDEKNRDRAQEDHGLEDPANDSPIIAKINQILTRAVKLQTSDIHIEPQEKEIKVRIRLDGSLRLLCSLPLAIHARLAARIKVMSNLLITERRLPQDGRFRVQMHGQKTEFRVSTMPSSYGEKIVLRVLGQGKVKGDVRHMGMNPRDLEHVERALRSPHGIILVTGPTGSGKTTSLYTMIGALNTPDVNIITVEDPVEYQMPGITQVQVKPQIGLTFEKTLRTFLRQDPDIILVGEIRDAETAEIAMKAAITGHLVLSTLHTNSAPATIARLTQMGLPAYLIAASVKLVIAQRLIKLLCPKCKVPAALSPEDLRFLSEAEAASMPQTYRAVGCEACNETGYAGRRPVFEVMPVAGSEMRQRILRSHNMDDLAELAMKEGMTPLRQEAVGAVRDGLTSLQEAMKIILAD